MDPKPMELLADLAQKSYAQNITYRTFACQWKKKNTNKTNYIGSFCGRAKTKPYFHSL